MKNSLGMRPKKNLKFGLILKISATSSWLFNLMLQSPHQVPGSKSQAPIPRDHSANAWSASHTSTDPEEGGAYAIAWTGLIPNSWAMQRALLRHFYAWRSLRLQHQRLSHLIYNSFFESFSNCSVKHAPRASNHSAHKHYLMG